jgi:CRISPR-associated protein Csb2
MRNSRNDKKNTTHSELWLGFSASESQPEPRVHLRVRFSFPVAKPVAIGRGRFRGFGLIVREST